MAAHWLTDVAKCRRLKRAPTLIPEVAAIGHAQRMNVRSDDDTLRGLEDQLAECVFAVHQVEKWKARVQARSREHLEKCPVCRVARIAVARRVIEPATNPRRQRDRWLPSRFCRKRSRTVRQFAPRAGLSRSPEEHVNGAAWRSDREEVMTAQCLHGYALPIRLTRGERTIVR